MWHYPEISADVCDVKYLDCHWCWSVVRIRRPLSRIPSITTGRHAPPDFREESFSCAVSGLKVGRWPQLAVQNGQIHSATHSPYKINGKQVRWGEDILGGTFLGHHGQWHADSTRGIIVPEQKDHPILSGVSDIWGNSDVYRTYMEGAGLPEGCTALVMGQPLMGRSHDNGPNPKLEPLLVSWFKH